MKFFINCLLSYSDYEKGNLFSSSSWWVEWSCIPGICSGYFPWLFHIEQWSCVTGWEHMIPVSGVNTGVIPRLSWSPLLQDSVLCQDYAKLLWSSGGNLAARLTVRWYQEVNCNSSTHWLWSRSRFTGLYHETSLLFKYFSSAWRICLWNSKLNYFWNNNKYNITASMIRNDMM